MSAHEYTVGDLMKLLQHWMNNPRLIPAELTQPGLDLVFAYIYGIATLKGKSQSPVTLSDFRKLVEQVLAQKPNLHDGVTEEAIKEAGKILNGDYLK